MRAGCPTHSNDTSTPFGQISLTASAVSTSGPRDEVGGAELAGERLLLRVGVDGDDRQRVGQRRPWMTLRPMPPTPITITLCPWETLARLNTAPTPVMTPQPSSDATSNGTLLVDRDALTTLDDGLLG
jgi:hypothetical protein